MEKEIRRRKKIILKREPETGAEEVSQNEKELG